MSRLGIEDRNKPPMGEVTIYSVRHEDSTPAEGSGDVVDVTAKLPFKVPVPPKPVEGKNIINCDLKYRINSKHWN